MAEEPENLTPVLLREMRERFGSLDAKVDGLRADIRELTGRVGMLGQGYANVSLRTDRVVGTVDRIERRLGLVEA